MRGGSARISASGRLPFPFFPPKFPAANTIQIDDEWGAVAEIVIRDDESLKKALKRFEKAPQQHPPHAARLVHSEGSC